MNDEDKQAQPKQQSAERRRPHRLVVEDAVNDDGSVVVSNQAIEREDEDIAGCCNAPSSALQQKELASPRSLAMATVVLNLRQRNVFQETVLRYLNSSTPGCIVVRLGGYSTDDAIAELNKHLSASWLSNFPSTVTHRLVLHGAGGPRHAGSPLLEYRQGATNHGNSLVVTVHPLPLGCVGFLKPLSIRSGSHAVPLSTTEAEQRIAKLPWHGVVDRALLPYDEVVHGPISLEVRIGHPVAAGDHAGWDAEHSTYAFRTMSPDVHLHEESTQLDFKSGCGDAKHPQLFSSPRTLTSKLSCLPELLNGSEAAQSGVFLVYGVTDDKGKPHTALGMLQDKASCSTCTISHEYFVDLLSSMNEELHASLFPPLPPNSGCLTLHEVQDCCTAVLSGDDIGDGDNSDDSNDSSELVVHFFSEEAAAAAHLRNALDGHGAVLYAPQHAQPFAIVSEAATPSHKDALRLPSAQLQQLVIDQGWQHLKRYVVVLHLTPPPAHVGSFFSTMRNASPPSAPVYETGPGGPRAAWLSRVGMWMRMRTEPEPHAHARLVGSGYTKLCIGPDDTQQLVRRYLVGEDVTFAARFTDIVSDEDQRKRARNTLMGDRLRQRLIVADLAAVLDGNALALINEDAGIGRGNPGSSIVILSRQLLTRTVCKALIPKLQVLRSHCTILDLAFVGLPGPSEPDFSRTVHPSPPEQQQQQQQQQQQHHNHQSDFQPQQASHSQQHQQHPSQQSDFPLSQTRAQSSLSASSVLNSLFGQTLAFNRQQQPEQQHQQQHHHRDDRQHQQHQHQHQHQQLSQDALQGQRLPLFGQRGGFMSGQDSGGFGDMGGFGSVTDGGPVEPMDLDVMLEHMDDGGSMSSL